MTIYTPIAPTYLYIKKHSITGLKYFGKTTKDPYKYNGSGKYWTNHIKKHGKEHIVTLWVSDPYHDKSIIDYALHFSQENNIVKSNEWANLKPENGLDGGTCGIPHNKGKKCKPLSEEHKAKISASNMGRTGHNKCKPASIETKYKQSLALKGRPKTAEHNAKVSIALTGKPKSLEHRAKLSAILFGKPGRNKGKHQTIIECPHCHKTGGSTNLKRYHFDNCKYMI
jgi:hypothetical protein